MSGLKVLLNGPTGHAIISVQKTVLFLILNEVIL